MPDLSPLKEFVLEVERLMQSNGDDGDLLADSMVGPMSRLVASDQWLPDAMAEPHPTYYQQHLLYADPQDRFSVVSFVWGPGQKTPVHNHTVWGVIGVLRGAEYGQRYDIDGTGAVRLAGTQALLAAGQVEVVSPTHGDVHVVRNAYDDKVSISIHLYGGNIGRIKRHVFDTETGERKDFISGYSATLDPAFLR